MIRDKIYKVVADLPLNVTTEITNNHHKWLVWPACLPGGGGGDVGVPRLQWARQTTH